MWKDIQITGAGAGLGWVMAIESCPKGQKIIFLC